MRFTIPQNSMPAYDTTTADILLILIQSNTLSGSQHEPGLFGAQTAQLNQMKHLRFRGLLNMNMVVIATKSSYLLQPAAGRMYPATSSMGLLWWRLLAFCSRTWTSDSQIIATVQPHQ